MEQDVIIMQEIFRFKQLGIDQNGRAYGQFEATGVRPTFVSRAGSRPASSCRRTCSRNACCCAIEVVASAPVVSESLSHDRRRRLRTADSPRLTD